MLEWSLSFSKFCQILPWQRFVNLPNLSIQVICQMAKAWWPLASTVVGLRWSDVYMLHISATAGEASQRGIYIQLLLHCLSPVAGAALFELPKNHHGVRRVL